MPEAVLVTGGAGFIGSHIAKRLLKMGYGVDVVDDLSTGFRSNVPEGARLILGDLTDWDFVESQDFTRYCGVFHLAGQSSGEKSFENPSRDILVNSASTAHLLQKSKEGKILHFLYASSMGVYGNPERQPVIESNLCVPISFYGCNKLASEQYCRIYQNLGLNTTCFRMFNVYGPGQNLENMQQGMVSIYLAFLLNREKVLIKGSLGRYRDFIFINDMADAWLKAFLNPKSFGKMYNVGSGKKTTVDELVKSLISIFKERAAIEEDYIVSGATPGDQNGIYADISNIREELQWTPKYNLEAGLKEMIRWAKKRTEWKSA